MTKESLKLRLNLIAAKAAQLSNDIGRQYPGDMQSGLNEIHEQIQQAIQESRGDR